MVNTSITSRDGTTIAFNVLGEGPPLILVDGALCYRAFGPMGPLAPVLAKQFTVFTYDRRGRGESGDTLPYAVEREIEDLQALFAEAGGSAFLYGVSSGAALALEAAAARIGVTKLALFQPPYDTDDATRPALEEYTRQLRKLVAAGRRGDAVALFLRDMMPPEALDEMKKGPLWPLFEGVAHTLVYDAAVLRDGSVPVERAASITAPTLVLQAGEDHDSIQQATCTLAKAILHAEHRTLRDQTLQAPAEVIAPLLIPFFRDQFADRIDRRMVT